MAALTFIVSVLLLASLSAAAMLVGFRRGARHSADDAQTLWPKRHLADLEHDTTPA
jgi:hypothetical protein